MKNYKEEFETVFGEGSFNDEFLVSAIAANNIHNKCLLDDDEIIGRAIRVYALAKNLSLRDFIERFNSL